MPRVRLLAAPALAALVAACGALPDAPGLPLRAARRDAPAQSPAPAAAPVSMATLDDILAAEPPADGVGGPLPAAGELATLHIRLGALETDAGREWAGLALRAQARSFETMMADAGACWRAADAARPDPAGLLGGPGLTVDNEVSGAVMNDLVARVDFDGLKTCLQERGYAGVVLSEPRHPANGRFSPPPSASANVAAAPAARPHGPVALDGRSLAPTFPEQGPEHPLNDAAPRPVRVASTTPVELPPPPGAVAAPAPPPRPEPQIAPYVVGAPRPFPLLPTLEELTAEHADEPQEGREVDYVPLRR